MRQRASVADQRFAIRPSNKTIEQPVPMNVPALFPVEKESDPAETMDADLHFRPATDVGFNRADRAQTHWMKYTRRREEHRIEDLWRSGDPCEKFQAPNGEPENQMSSLSTGARSATD